MLRRIAFWVELRRPRKSKIEAMMPRGLYFHVHLKRVPAPLDSNSHTISLPAANGQLEAVSIAFTREADGI